MFGPSWLRGNTVRGRLRSRRSRDVDSVRPLPTPAEPAAGGREERAIPKALLLAVVVYMAVYGLWQMSSVGGSDRSTIADAAFLPGIVAAILAAYGAWRRNRPGRTASAWLLIELALIAYALGDVVQGVYESYGDLPSLSLMDPLYLSFYPLFLAGLLRFPSIRMGRTADARLLLDAITVGIAGACAVWYLVLGPTATASSESTLESVVSTAYPTGDLILIGGLANLLVRVRHQGSRRSIRLLTLGVVLYLVADVIYVRMELTGAYSGEGAVNMLYVLATCVFALAASSQGSRSGPSPADRTWEQGASGRRAIAALPYVSVGVVLAMMVETQTSDRFFPDLSLTITGTVAALLVLFSQFLSRRELMTTHEDLRTAHRRLAALATTDPLTELPNHRALVEAIDTEMERSRRYGHTCALLFVDIDFFKELNDTHGHTAGDRVLREIGAIMDAALRTIDTVGRWGGEEFVAVLPEIDAEAARATGERLRQSVAVHSFGERDQAHLTVSVGVAAYPRDGSSRTELLDAADRAMYAAKRMGRNQCFSAADPVVGALQASPEKADRIEERAILSAVEALATLVEARDGTDEDSADAVASLAQSMALDLGCDTDRARRTYLAARLHDIGKVAVADAILRKPGKLSAEEWRLMREHPAVGADVVARIGSLSGLAPIIRSHHERYDGQGYPDGLRGKQIPLEARIVAAADAFDAMTSERPYRRRLALDEARQEMHRCAGTQFDPAVVEALDRALTSSAKGERARPRQAKRDVAASGIHAGSYPRRR